jgi:hypothetical protein
MRSAIPAALLAVGLAACSDSSEPGSWALAYAGIYNLAVTESPDCWPAFVLEFTIDQEDVQSATEERFTTTGTWSGWGSQGGTTGEVNQATRTVAIQFQEGSKTAELTGDNRTPPDLVGTFTDTEGLFGPAGCASPAVATQSPPSLPAP